VGADVILTAVVLALVALVCADGIGVTWWALFGDKARGRRRCPRCWHDLSGTPGRTCGECGFEAIDEPELFATRRRWPIAVSSVAFILAVAGWVRDYKGMFALAPAPAPAPGTPGAVGRLNG
jgi:hypothetical protein